MRSAADTGEFQKRVHQIIAVPAAGHILVDDQLTHDIGRLTKAIAALKAQLRNAPIS